MQSGPSVKLSEHLPRLLQRLDVLDQTTEVETQRQAIEFALEQFPRQSPSLQMRYVLAASLFVGELEHGQLLDSKIAKLSSAANRAKAARDHKPEPEWHELCAAKARNLLRLDRKQHELAGILSKGFGKGPKAVREVLKKRAY